MVERKQAEKLLNEFADKLTTVDIPDFRFNRYATVKITLPPLAQIDHSFDRQLLQQAQLSLRLNKGIEINLSRSGEQVTLTFSKRF